MALPVNNAKGGKAGSKNQKNNAQSSKFIVKPGKALGVTKKPIKTGGSRGS